MNYFLNNNETLNHQVDSFFSELSSINEKEYGGKLSVLLLGSLSRGEGTWIRNDAGDIQILSDIEFFTVYSKGFDKFNDYNVKLEELRTKYFPNQNNKLFHIDNCFIKKEVLPFIEKKLITYDAQMTGKCVVGNDIRKLLPKISIRNINYIDIRDVLAHRIFSIMYYKFNHLGNNDPDEYHYVVSKNILDFMVVYLVLHGKIASGFTNRFNLIVNSNILPQKQAVFEHCLSVKMRTQTNNSFSTQELEKEFLSFANELYTSFTIPMRTYYYNFFHIAKRKLGIMKRSFKIKKVPITQNKHIKQMLNLFNNGKPLRQQDIIHQYIINGHPKDYLRNRTLSKHTGAERNDMLRSRC